MESLPPAWNPAKFNTSAFLGKIYLTKQEADGLYLSITSGRNLGLIDGITPGIVSASKAVIVDSSKDIIGFNNIQSATIDCNGLNINNSTDLNLYGTTNAIHMHSTTSSTILMSGSIFNSITMQASAGFILMSGANQYVYLSGNANYIKIDNTSASTSSSTGTIRTAGGIYCGNNSIISANLTMDNITSNLTISGTNSSLNLTGASGILTISNTSASTGPSSGSIINSGGIYCGANSYFGGNINCQGSQTLIGSLSIGTDLLVSGNTTFSGTLTITSLASILTAQIIDTNNASIVYPLTIQHLLSSGSPVDNALQVGLKFQMPNSINNPADYGAIGCEVQQHASGLQQGQLNFYTSFAGSLVNAMTLSSLTSSTNNILVLNGATSLFSAYRLVCDNVLCNSNILISKATLPNLTITSSSSSTLSLCYFNTDAQNWELGARGSTASNPNSFYLYNAGYMYTISNTGITKFFNTDVSLTSTSNAFQVSGGLYNAKAILSNSYYNCNTINSSATSHAVSNQAICLNNHAIYFRGQNASDTDSGVMYSKNASWNSGNGFASANIDGPVLFGKQGVIIGNLNSGSTETLCAAFVGTLTSLYGDLNIGSPYTNIASIDIATFGQALSIQYSSTVYGSLAVESSGAFTLTASNSNYSPTFSKYYFGATNGIENSIGLNNAVPRSRLDFGNTFNDCIITLYQASSSSGTYMIGANSSANEYTSAGANGHQFYYYSGTTPHSLGNNVFSMLGNGVCQSGSNFIAGHGCHANSYNTTGLAAYGMCAHMHYGGSNIGNFFTYNYNTSTYGITIIGNNSIYSNANGTVGILTAGGTFPLEVGYNTQTVTSYGYLTSSGATGTSGSSGAVNFSAKFLGRIAVATEIDVYSDRRLKENIEDLSDDYINNFINNVKPKIYNKKESKSIKELGYIAQDIVKNDLFELYMTYACDIDEEVDSDGFINPKNLIFTVNYQKICCILHKKILMQDEIIKRNEAAIAELRELIKPAQEPIVESVKLKRSVKKFKRIVI